MLRFNDFYVCPLKYVVMSANSPFVTVHSAVFRHGSAFSRSDDEHSLIAIKLRQWTVAADGRFEHVGFVHFCKTAI